MPVTRWGLHRKLLLVVLFFVACHPVKRVLQDPVKFETVAREVVKRGYCLNDTTVRDTLVQLIIRDSLVHDTLLVPEGGQIPVTASIDTTFASGARLQMEASGAVTITCPVKTVEKTVGVNHFIRDRKKEQLLLEDLDERDQRISDLQRIRYTLQQQYEAKQSDLKTLQKKVRTRTLQLIGILALLAVFIGYKLFKNIRSLISL